MSCPMADLEKFNLECLERLNELRRQFKVPPLKLRLSLIQRPAQIESYCGAQDWADNLACNDILQSDADAAKNDIGESICRMFSEKFCTFSGSALINAWFDEAVEFKGLLVPEKPSYPVNFLQLIWSHTRYCGFGFAVSQKTSAMYAVARFKPILPMQNQVLVPGFNQQVQNFDAITGSLAFKNTILGCLSQDVSYVKRNLFCCIPENTNIRVESLLLKSARYRLSHLVRQIRVVNRIGRVRMGWVYVNEHPDKYQDAFIIMQNEE